MPRQARPASQRYDPLADPEGGAAPHLYRLYVSMASPMSARATVNARRFLERHLPGRHRLAVHDIASHISLAQRDQVIASPTLIRIAPLPQRRIIGDMSDAGHLCQALGLQGDAERTP